MTSSRVPGTWTPRCLGTSNDYNLKRTTHVPVSNAPYVQQFAKLAEVRQRRGSSVVHILTFFPPSPSSNIARRAPNPQQALRECVRRRDVIALGQGLGEDGTQPSAGGGLAGRVVAFTTPLQYATRFEKLLRDEGVEPLWCPTIVTEQTERTRLELEGHLGRSTKSGDVDVRGVAFTSRAGIRAFAEALDGRQLPWNGHGVAQEETEGDVNNKPFVVAALGKDAELLQELKVVGDSPRVSVVVPAISTPRALVEALGRGEGRKILCPVPLVEGLDEPPVVPQFLRELSGQGWDPVRVNSYVTRWLGWDCALPLVVKTPTAVRFKPIDALVFTSTAEVEGLLKSCRSLGLAGTGTGAGALRRGSRQFLVACHGPVTAMGAERLGVEVDVVGKEFQSFAGVIKELEAEFRNVARNDETEI